LAQFIKLGTDMAVKRYQLMALALGLGCMGSLPAQANEAGDKGAEIYCFMRKTGNSHNVSWKAAYERIKRQGNGLFKTSPKHAAVMMTESVVTEQDKFQDCGKYLGALYSGSETAGKDFDAGLSESNNDTDRYSY
jgi:hypothetical protein|tara:strand:- start:226 stop:630 length:405 start_codon:yes stop_codon:yes gene_type:complete